jgi:transcriptional regulator of NAD metabolism
MKIMAETQTETIIADRIMSYLESHQKSADAQVLQDTMARMRQVIVKDLMQPRDTRAGA